MKDEPPLEKKTITKDTKLLKDYCKRRLCRNINIIKLQTGYKDKKDAEKFRDSVLKVKQFLQKDGGKRRFKR